MKYLILGIPSYLISWTLSYLTVFILCGDGLDFSYYFSYLGLAWTFSGGEIPTYIWVFSLILFLPIMWITVYGTKHYKQRMDT